MIVRLLVIAMLLFPALPGYAQQTSTSPIDARTEQVLQKADRLFDQGQYERAYRIYRNQLAPIGDKFSQYMVGYMHEKGHYVDRDPVAASAWYRLAAERNDKLIGKVRDTLMRRLDDVELGQSDLIYLDLRKRYSDVVIRMKLVRKDFDQLTKNRTGSRLSAPTSPTTIVDFRDGTSLSADTEYADITDRIMEHVDHITDTLDIDPIIGDLTAAQLADLEFRVGLFVSSVDDR